MKTAEYDSLLAKYENPPLTADQQSEPIVIDDDEDEIQIESVESMEICAKSVPRNGTKPRKRKATEKFISYLANKENSVDNSDDDESIEIPESVSRKGPRPVNPWPVGTRPVCPRPVGPWPRKRWRPKNPSTEKSNSANKENSIGDFNKTLTRSR